MATPSQCLLLQRHNDFSVPLNRAGLGMAIVSHVGDPFEVGFFSPGIGLCRFSAPSHFGLGIDFIALGFPIARPKRTLVLNVAAFFRWLGGRKLWGGIHRGWDQRQRQ